MNQNDDYRRSFPGLILATWTVEAIEVDDGAFISQNNTDIRFNKEIGW